MSAVRDWLYYLLYSALWFSIRHLPERSAYQLFDRFAARAHRRDGRHVKRLRENYRAVRPEISEHELEELVRLGLGNSMRYWCDTFRISDWDLAKTSSSVTTTRVELLFENLSAGRGLIVALPHAGNWDHAGLYFCSQGVTVHTVAEHLKPERLFEKFLSHRSAMGMKVLDINSGVIGELEGILRSGGLVALPADRDLSRSGIDVEFFGRNARMPAGPALLAIRTGAPLITAYVRFVDAGIHIEFSGPHPVREGSDERAEVARLTQELAKQFEADIARDPASWHMQQRIFVDRQKEDSERT